MGLFKLNSIYLDELWAVISSIDFTVFFLIFFLIIFKPLFPCRITIFYFGLSLLKIRFTSVLHLNIKFQHSFWRDNFKCNYSSRKLSSAGISPIVPKIFRYEVLDATQKLWATDHFVDPCCHLPRFQSFDDHPIFQQLKLGHGKVFCSNFL